jgi:phosphonate transport system substrate-binding protein
MADLKFHDARFLPGKRYTHQRLPAENNRGRCSPPRQQRLTVTGFRPMIRHSRDLPSPAALSGWLWLALLLFCGVSMAADPGVLRFGVFPRWNAQQMVREFTPLAQLLTRSLGHEVRIETDKDFDAFMKRVYAREFDVVHLNQLQYLRAHSQAGYQVIAGLCESPECTIRALIVARSDAGLREIGDLRGKAVAFGGRDAMVSHVLARELLRRRGLPPEDYKTVFTTNPPNALLTVYNGEAEAAGVGSGVLQRSEITRRVDVARLRILAESEAIPPLPVAVRNDLDSQLVQRLREALLGMADIAGGESALARIGAIRFAPVKHEDYEALQSLAEPEHRDEP